MSRCAVDWDDVYCALVRAILKGAAGGPSAAQLEIAVCMAGLFRAVPAWMLKFGTITNKDYSALAGLQTFQVTYCSHAWHMCAQWSAADDACVDLSL